MNRCTNRSVSFVERIELEFHGNHFCHSLSLGDVDGDGLNEFIIGNVDGTLEIFKGNESKKPWRIAKNLGTITCTGTGDIFNSGKIQLVCVNAAGLCHIFSVYRFISPRKGNSVSSISSVSDSKHSSPEIQPKHIQELYPNIKVILIGNIASDGKEELFVGRTDRIVNVYRWSTEAKSLQHKNSFTFEGQIGSLSVSMTAEGTAQLLVSQTGGTYIPLWYQEVIKEEEMIVDDQQQTNLLSRMRKGSSVSHDGSQKDDKEVSISISGDETGKSFSKENESLHLKDGQLIRNKSGSVAAAPNTSTTINEPTPSSVTTGGTEGPPAGNLLASSSGTSLKALGTTSSSSLMNQYQLRMGATVGLVQRNNPSSSTEIIGDLQSRPDLLATEQEPRHSNIVALCTLDGAIRFLKDEKKIWEHQVDHNLFSISKLDVTNNGEDEIVVCAWNGTTYILDQSRNVVRYKFEDNVCAFTAGYFGFFSEHNKPCLIYTTFFNKIYIYHSIQLTSIPPTNLIMSLQEQEKFEKLKDFMSNLEDSEKATVIRQLLYQKSN